MRDLANVSARRTGCLRSLSQSDVLNSHLLNKLGEILPGLAGSVFDLRIMRNLGLSSIDPLQLCGDLRGLLQQLLHFLPELRLTTVHGRSS
jgi:hypothetical protein